MSEFSIELANSIINLEMQKERILKQDIKLERLCYCRKQILYNFTSVCQMFFIRFTARIIKFLEDGDIDKTTSINDLKQWYEHEIYKKLFDNDDTSNKMIVIFKLLQDNLDEQFFQLFNYKFKGVIEKFTPETLPEFKTELLEVYADVYDWIENHLLNILSIKIDCSQISDEIIDFYSNNNPHNATVHRCDVFQCPSTDANHLMYAEEEIHLYMSDEFDNEVFLVNYFDIIAKYHKFPQNIKITFDFILYDEERFKFTELLRNITIQNLGSFKSVAIINYKNVDFGPYYNDIKGLLQ
jgi:hypothetical protein